MSLPLHSPPSALLRWGLSGLVTTVLCLITTTGSAEPLFTASQCAESNQAYVWNLDDGDPIYLYVQQDIGTRLANSGCLDGLSSEGMSTAHFVVAVQEAAEIWNREARAAVFKYAGAVSGSSLETACNSMTKQPSIFIKFSG